MLLGVWYINPIITELKVKEKRERDGSFLNEVEGMAVVALIDACLKCGIEPLRIGCVALYRAQALYVSSLLSKTG